MHPESPTACPTPDQLAAYDRGDLSAEEIERVGAHVEHCAACLGVLAALEPASDSLISGVRRTSSLETSDGEPPAPPGALDTADGLPSRLGQYELLERIGSGATGAVYKARNTSLKCVVALKVLKTGVSRAQRRRFEREAETVARLRHANVVWINDLCESDGYQYAVHEYVPGGNLAQRIAGTLPDHRAAAHLMLGICRGVQAAHDLNLVHLDLKPANVLLSGAPGAPLGECTPKVADFGLARLLETGNGEDSYVGVVVGTPSYMSPEQAAGRPDLGPAADVYGLGAILYELLTGRPPFLGTSPTETVQLVLNREPSPPRALQPGVPRDLETICLKCVEKDSGRRYATAAGVADELERYLDGRPILARPVSRFEKARRWAKRNPTIAALSGFSVCTAVALLVTALSLVSAHFDAEKAEAERRELTARAEAERRELAAKAAAERAEKEKAEELRRASDLFRHTAEAGRLIAAREPGWTWKAAAEVRTAAQLDTPLRDPTVLRSALVATLAGTDLREARVLLPDRATNAVCFHPNGRWVVLAPGYNGLFNPLELTVRIVDFESAAIVRELKFPPHQVGPNDNKRPDMAYAVAVSPDGRWLVVGTRSGVVHRWDLSAAEPRRNDFRPEPVTKANHVGCTALAFAPDGSALYVGSWWTGGNSLSRWETATWTRTARRTPGPDSGELAVQAYGEAVYCPDANETVAVLDPVTLATVRTFGAGHTLASFPGSGATVTGDSVALQRGNQLALWHQHSNRVQYTFREPQREGAFPAGVEITGMRFSPDGRLLAAWSEFEHQLYLWDVATGERAARWRLPVGRTDAAFDPTGRFLVVTGQQGATVLEIAGQREHRTVAIDPYGTVAGAVAPDGRALGTLIPDPNNDGRAYPAAWDLNADLATGPVWDEHTFGSGWFHPSVAFSQDGTQFAPLSGSEVRVFDRLRSSIPIAALRQEGVHQGAFDASGRYWFVADRAVCCSQLPIASQRWLSWEKGPSGTALPQMYSVAAGRAWVVAGGRDGALSLFDADVRDHDCFPPHVRTAALEPRSPLGAVAVAPNDTTAVAGTESGNLYVVSLPDLTVRATLRGHSDAVTSVVWLGDGLFASAGWDRAVRLWHWDGTAVREQWTHRAPQRARQLGAARDGRVLSVVYEGERGVHVWDLVALNRTFGELGLAVPAPATWAVEQLPARVSPPVPPDESSWPANGLRCELFRDGHLRASLSVAHEPTVYRSWGVWGGRLAPRAHFGARFTGYIRPPKPGPYEFRFVAGNSVRAWIDNSLVCDKWHPSGAATVEYTTLGAQLTGEPHELRVECMLGRWGDAFVQVLWRPAGEGEFRPIPDTCLFRDRATAARARIPADPRSTDEVLSLTAPMEATFTAVALCPDARVVAAGTATGGVYLWDRNGKVLFARPNAHGDPVAHVAISPDRARVVSAGAASGLIAWDATGTELARRPGSGPLAFTPDGARLVAVGPERTAQFLEAARLDLRASAKLDFAPTVVRWDTAGSEVRIAGAGRGTVWNPSTGVHTELSGWTGPARALLATDVVAELTFATPPATEVGERGAVCLFDAATGFERARHAGTSPIGAVAGDATTNRVAVALRPETVTREPQDFSVRVWDPRSHRPPHLLLGHTGVVRALDWSAGTIATASADGTVRLWKAPDRRR